MGGRLKGNLINGAYSRLRISGLTIQPTSEDLELALDRMEMMLGEFEYGRNICLNYNFEETPNPNTYHNIGIQFWDAVESNLAVRLLSDFGKGVEAVDPILLSRASAGFALLSAQTAKQKEAQYPARMPRGSGSTLRYERWSRFYRPTAEAPLECATIIMDIGETNDYTETWADYTKDTETISSYSISTDNGITLVSSSLSSPVVSYRITATGRKDGLPNDLLQMTITVTTSLGRVNTRTINFKFNELPDDLTQVVP